MSGIAIKITSLLIRTVSKPIASRIKAQAREHERFRQVCVGCAQYLHRVDMRLRLGLLNDPAKLERQAAREAEAAAKKKREAEIPTVKTEAQTKKAEEEAAAKDGGKGATAADTGKPKIKPLSESKAIDMGANFIAESFLFAVAVGTLFFDQYRSRKKEHERRSDVADRIAELVERDEAKTRRIEEMERQMRELRGHDDGWRWPWQHKGQEATQEPVKAEKIVDAAAAAAAAAAAPADTAAASVVKGSAAPAPASPASVSTALRTGVAEPALAASAPEALSNSTNRKDDEPSR